MTSLEGSTPPPPLGPGGGGTPDGQAGGFKSHAAMLAAIFSFASGLIVSKSLVLKVSPGEILIGQLVIGALLLWGYLLYRPGRPRFGGVLWRMALMGISAPGLVNILNILGMQHTSAVNMVILWALMPVLTQFAGRLFLGEALRLSQIVGCIVAFSGVMLILGTRHGGAGSLLGDALIFGAVLCSIATQLLGRRVNQRADNLCVAAVQVTAAVGLSIAVYPWLSDGPPLDGWSASALVELAYLGLFSTFMLFLFYNIALRRLPVGRVGLLMTMVPAFGTVGASAYLGERVGPTDLIGLAIVMIGVALPFSAGLFKRRR